MQVEELVQLRSRTQDRFAKKAGKPVPAASVSDSRSDANGKESMAPPNVGPTVPPPTHLPTGDEKGEEEKSKAAKTSSWFSYTKAPR